MNTNIGAKRNLAANKAKSKYLCFIDSDAFPGSYWLNYHYKNLKKFHISGGPNISYVENNGDKEIVSRVRLLNFVTYDPDTKKKIFKKKFVDFLPACNFCIRKETYLQMGGMAENLFTNEELQLMDNLKKKQKKILLDPKPFVFHQERSIKNFFFQRMNYGSSLLYNFINYPSYTTFLGLVSLTPIILMFSIFLVPFYNVFIYIFLTQFFVSLIISIYFATKIKKQNSFFKCLLVVIISVYGIGVGFIFTLIDHKKLKKFYIQS